MASLTGQTVSSTYDGLLKTDDNDILGAAPKEITDGLGNGSGMTLTTTGDVGIAGDLSLDGALLDSSGDVGTNGQVLSSTVTGTNWIDVSGGVDSVNAGTGISVDVTTGNVTVTNAAPDQTVSLTDGGDIAISGTYPSFTLTNSAPNATHTGDVTGATALTISDDVITYAKLGIEYTTTAIVSASTIDFSAAQVFTKTMTGNTTFSITNAQIGMVKDLYLTGDYTFSITNGKLIAGTYDGTVTNFIQIVAQSPTSFWYSISQEQV